LFGVLFGMLDHCLRAYTLPRAGRSRKISELLLETLEPPLNRKVYTFLFRGMTEIRVKSGH
jgi:hypothetical protein